MSDNAEQNNSSDAAPQRRKPDRFEAARLVKLEQIEKLGHDPWGQRFDNHISIKEARDKCPEENGTLGEKVRIAGRLMTRRKQGKLRFFNVKDWSEKIQLLFSRGELSEEQWELMGALDLGDLVGIDGFLKRTDRDRKSVV